MVDHGRHDSPHWSADFVEHIRTVHFSLVAVCLTLIGVAQLKQPRDLTTAQHQLQDVKSAAENWKSPEMQGAVQKVLQESNVVESYPMPPPPGTLVDNAFTLGGETVVLYQLSVILIPAGAESDERVIPGFKWRDDELFQQPNSLAQFRDFWDRKPVVLSPEISELGHKILVLRKDGSTQVEGYQLEKTTQSSRWEFPMVDKTKGSEERLIGAELHVSPAPFVLSWSVGQDRAFLPVKVSQTPLNIQGALVQTHSYWKEKSGKTFSVAFSELDKATAAIQGRSFGEIGSILQEEAAKEAAKAQGDHFEVLAIKFPVESASLWGIVLVVGIQLYLWIHLHELSPRLREGDAGWDVAWVGVYRSLPARLLYLSSTALLPMLTIILLGERAAKSAAPWNRVFYVAALLSSSALSFLIIKWVPQRRTALKSAPQHRPTTAHPRE